MNLASMKVDAGRRGQRDRSIDNRTEQGDDARAELRPPRKTSLRAKAVLVRHRLIFSFAVVTKLLGSCSASSLYA